uniref:Uncharacterized protein n=1 Tax=Setaria italica TaxID=4555 RepID=K3Z179_SETIT
MKHHRYHLWLLLHSLKCFLFPYYLPRPSQPATWLVVYRSRAASTR